MLGIETDRKFNVINFNVNKNWPYASRCTPFEMLQFLLNRSKKFRIFIGNGVFDLVTSVGQVAYTVSQLKYEEGQVTVREYPAGTCPIWDTMAEMHWPTISAPLFGRVRNSE